MKPAPAMRAAVQKLLCLLCILLCGAVWAQDAKVRASLATNDTLWVGQKMTLVVELLAPGFFARAPSFDLPNPQGVLLIPPAEHPVVSSETIDNTSYTVQRHELSVLAQRAGEHTIPPFPIRFQFKRNPLDKDPVSAEVKTEPVRFTAKLPPGAESLGSVISARDLKVTETWQPEPGRTNLKTGDAFTRVITFSAPDVPAMAFPPFPAGPIDGLGVYSKPAELLDRSERGSLLGERRDTITYVCQRPGRWVIPAARLTWWDLETRQLRTNDFPARVLQVLPNPALESQATAADSTSGAAPFPRLDKRGTAIGFASLAGLALLGVLMWKTRRIWRTLLAALHPVHLAPLNPGAGESRSDAKGFEAVK